MEFLASGAWITDWLWGLPLIVLASVIHVIGLGAIELAVERSLKRAKRVRGHLALFVAVVGETVLAATALHAVGGSRLGRSLPLARRSSRRALGDAVFNWRDDDLRPCKPPSF
jgi:branched-subunit amino acid ABC-type transport system permease component